MAKTSHRRGRDVKSDLSDGRTELDAALRRVLAREYGDGIKPRRGDLKLVEPFLGDEGKKRLEERLERFGLKLSDVEFIVKGGLGHYLSPRRYEQLSKSVKVTHSIDVVRMGQDEPVLQMYVKYTDMPAETAIAALARERGWSGEVFNNQDFTGKDTTHVSNGKAIHTQTAEELGRVEETTVLRAGGLIVEERLPRGSSIRKMGISFDEQESANFGATLARKVRDMIDNNVIFDFSGVGATHVRVIEKENREQPFHLKISEAGSDTIPIASISELASSIAVCRNETIRHHMSRRNDFAEWIRHSLGDPELADKVEAVKFNPKSVHETRGRLFEILDWGARDVKFIGADNYETVGGKREEAIIPELMGVVRLLSNIGGRVRPSAWSVFEREFTGEKPGIFRMFGQEAADYWWRRNLISEVRKRLCESEDSLAAEHWRRFFNAVDTETKPEATPIETEMENADMLATSLEGLGVSRDVGTAIAVDVVKARTERGEDPRDVMFSLGESAGTMERIIDVLDTSYRRVGRYAVRQLAGDERANFVTAYNARLAPTVLKTTDPAAIAYELPAKLDELPPEEFTCAEIGTALSNAITRGFRNGLLPRTLKPQDIVVYRGEYGLTATFSDWSKVTDMREMEVPSDRMAAMQEYITRNAGVILTLPHPEIAWKSFCNSFRWTSALDEAQAAENRGVLDSAVDVLKDQATWTQLLEESKTALVVKGEFRQTQSRWLVELGRIDPLAYYHPNTRKTLSGLEATIHEGVTRLFDLGYFEDVIADARHAHILVPGDENTVLDAKLGSLRVDRGMLLFELYEMEPNKARRLKNRFIVRFDGRGVHGPEEVDDEKLGEILRTHVSPAAFKAYLKDDPSGGFEVGGQRYSLQWVDNYFRDTEAIGNVKKLAGSRPIADVVVENADNTDVIKLRQEVELEREWERVINTTVDTYRNWLTVMRELIDARDSLPEQGDHRRNFVLGRFQKQAEFLKTPGRIGLSQVIGASCPDFIFDSRFENVDFGRYGRAPELLDYKVETAYPNLAEYAEHLFTLEDAMQYVYKREAEIGARLSEREQVELLKSLEEGGMIKPVKVKGKKPHEYIKDIRYQKDANHYVVRMTIDTESGERQLILKQDDLMKEIVPSSILMHIRRPGSTSISTPMVIAFSPEYGVESVKAGNTIDKCDPALKRRHGREIAFALGMFARVSNLCGDGHPGNTLLSDSGEVNRIDLERTRRWERDPDKTLLYYITCFELDVMRTHIPDWSDKRQPYWFEFTEGMRHADRELKDPRVTSDIRELVRRLMHNYPASRTGLTRRYREILAATLGENAGKIIAQIIGKQASIWAGISDNNPIPSNVHEMQFWTHMAR